MNINQNQLNTKTYATSSNLLQNGSQIALNPNNLLATITKQMDQAIFDIRSLTVGQTFQGEVMDIRSNQITININNQTLTAKFNNTVNANIGEVLNFVVKETSDNQVIISPVIGADYSALDQTIDKALEAANLVPTDKNLDIITALLKNNMPVDKQTLQTLISTSFRFPEAAVEDLVLMTKYNLDITSENIEQFKNYKNYEHQLTTDMKELLSLLPDSLSKIDTMQGTETLVKFLASVFPENPEITKEMIFSTELKNQITEQLLKQWTIRPEELDAKALNKTYETLFDQMSLLKELKELNLPNSKELSTTAAKIQDNLSFIKNLNDNFIYTQLPLQFNNQVTQGDLYVYTDKRNKLNLEQGISLLLHLDLEHLGAMEISVKLRKDMLQTTFSVHDELTETILVEHLQQLESSLKEKGYFVDLKVEQNQEKDHIDFVTDFLDTNAAKLDIKRYSFDIRI